MVSSTCTSLSTQYTVSLASYLVFSMSIWLLCSSHSGLGCCSADRMTHLPFMATLLTTVRSSLNVLYGHMSCFIFSCLIDSILMGIPTISSSSFSEQCCLDNQSAMYRSGPGLYTVHISYWWILRRMHCTHWYTVATSFLNIMTREPWPL